MNKKQILASLNYIANNLDNLSLFEEANNITSIMTKIAAEYFDDLNNPLDPEQIKKEFNEGVEQILANLKLPMYEKNVLKLRIKAYLHWYYTYPSHHEDKLKNYKNYNGNVEFFKGESQIYNFLEYMLNKYNIEPKQLNRMITRPIKMNEKYD